MALDIMLAMLRLDQPERPTGMIEGNVAATIQLIREILKTQERIFLCGISGLGPWSDSFGKTVTRSVPGKRKATSLTSTPAERSIWP